MPAKIPATVITGFLGAGKTTLIRHMLENAEGKRIALIINEFGDLGVDGDILKGCGDETCTEDDIMELSNGCICCTVADDFVPTMEKLLARDNKPDHIVIETSGLALPQPLIRAFNWPEISTQVTVDGVVTVVDGKAVSEGRFAHNVAAVDAQRKMDENLDHETPLSELFEDQIACADMIVVNKSDLLGAEASDSLAKQLKSESRDGVQVVKASMGALPVDVLLGQGIGAEGDMKARNEVHHHHHDHDDEHHDDDHHDDHHHHHDHDHDAFESFVIERGEITDATTFAVQVADVIRTHDILRLKGFAAVSGKPMRLTLQAVGPRVDTYFDKPFDSDARITRLVVIGQAGLDQAAIAEALKA
ncbi:MAG: cobalamin biosynthesis protein CobW [Planktotalea sp.]|jgi:cobalamin biosynthesis protein CobW|uniref:cobalamin biosynthesis protein CobW n=1 Tax=Planktotalea sp. TaxID=2029877 RepID=UPI000183A34C|nr:cobalamin biosynthesis protein CobW [Planktotalea sp.]EDZ43806.1 cobalamin biosynthesis protein CobW [Rhodobacteraceae bacterium HTCC2083]MBT5822230.1 cobalamin biosynthesis protein CobW [Paracoccaceae bacterium]MDG1075877.1 cobalamin biosynthesis protein CobW [Planktotalea sp.]MDG1083168.1 cobalamin biosynthesis protein CobW [Planktotalea sp.]HCW83974.1 cobalamin biosynthesis protein CobW [Paracoccaceae bacterium]